MNEKVDMPPEEERDRGSGDGIMGVPIEEVTAALREGARDARRLHKALGVPIVIWRDGKVVEVLPEEIVV